MLSISITRKPRDVTRVAEPSHWSPGPKVPVRTTRCWRAGLQKWVRPASDRPAPPEAILRARAASLSRRAGRSACRCLRSDAPPRHV
jgi:hypothetical protein